MDIDPKARGGLRRDGLFDNLSQALDNEVWQQFPARRTAYSGGQGTLAGLLASNLVERL